jgi:hypothetical protein
MKKTFATTVFVFFSLVICFSQDVITKKTGEDIQAKILEVDQTNIKYKKFDNLEGPSFIVPKSDVLIVRYSNGTKDIFTEEKTISTDVKAVTIDTKTALADTQTNPSDICDQATNDSKTNYIGRNSGTGWVLATTALFSPLIGIIPAVACSASKPTDQNLNYKDSKLMKNNAYNKCYTDEAYKTKKNRIWTSFGVGAGAWLVIILLASSGG